MRASAQERRVREPAELEGLAVRSLLSWRAPARITIDSADVPVARLRFWEARLAKLQGACGCEQGGVGLIAGVLGYFLYLLLRPGGLGSFGNSDIWAGLAVLFISTTAGKVIGLRIAQRELRKAVREIRAQWAAQGIVSSGWFHGSTCCGDRSGTGFRNAPSDKVMLR